MSLQHALDSDARCPFHAGRDDRKSAATAAAARASAPSKADLVVENFALARKILRSGGTRQAGFMAEMVTRVSGKDRTPVLYQEGEIHQKQRSATARYFAPRVVTTRYRDLMNALSDRLIGKLEVERTGNLADISMEMAVAVAAEIIGLTDSPLDRMTKRLNAFFDRDTSRKLNLVEQALTLIRNQWNMWGFYLFDVVPAIRARRKVKKEDVISHLVSEGYSNRAILTECLTYGAAGMVTTREFIVMSAWHMLERPELKEEFMAADEAGRLAILEELLRLEPVVGALYRRTVEDLEITEAGETRLIPAGTLIDMDLRAANTDPEIAGECPYQVEAGRKAGAGMSFGDGNHRCPGAAVALQESAIFLERLFRVPGLKLEKPPRLLWSALTVGYELRDAVLTCG